VQPSKKPDTVLPKQVVAQDVTISNDYYTLTFSGQTGLLSSVSNLNSGVTTPINQSFFWYNSSSGNVAQDQNPGRASGAYAFRPNCTENVLWACEPFSVGTGKASISVTSGALVNEVRQVFSDWVTQTVRLYMGSPSIEVEYTVGPIPIDDSLGKEVVSRWSTPMRSAGVFYTDANGRDKQKRVRNFRPSWNLTVTDPVSGNYYPVNSAIMLNDGQNQLTILTDRSMGGSSLRDGQLELMVQRRVLHDDGFGVGEPLNETESDYYGKRVGKGIVFRGTQRVVFDTVARSPQLHRTQQEQLTFPPVLSFVPFTSAVPDFIKQHRSIYSGVKTPLPPQVHLLTLADNSFLSGGPNTVLIRLAHKYEVGEDPSLSQPAEVDLSTLFSDIELESCIEMSLSANQPLSAVHRMVWQTETPFPPSEEKEPLKPKDSLQVTISAMQIRTFECVKKT